MWLHVRKLCCQRCNWLQASPRPRPNPNPDPDVVLVAPLLSPKNSWENRKYKGKSEHKNGKVFNSKWEANWIAHKLFKGHTNFKDSFGNQFPDLFIIIHFISLRPAFIPLLIYVIKCVIHVVCAIPMNRNPINVSAVCYNRHSWPFCDEKMNNK